MGTNRKPYRDAFSLLELIFVIVILGIVSSLGSEIIAEVYKNYILQRAYHRASIKTELATTQIANRLVYAIPGTAIRRVGKTGAPEALTDELSHGSDDYTVLQWVGYDADSFTSHDGSGTDERYPGWSGFCDVDASTHSSIVTRGSNLDLADTIIRNLSKNTSGVATKDITDAAIYFPNIRNEHNISAGTAETITLESNATKIVEHYKLAWSSYALVVENGDLFLYYNFTPATDASIGTNKSLLLKNISTFKFRGDGHTIRLKICKNESIGEDFNITSCKEMAVF